MPDVGRMSEYAEALQQAEHEQEDELLISYLVAKRNERDAAERAEALHDQALAILRRRGEGFAAPGLGMLKVFYAEARTILDVEKVKRILARYGEEPPTKETAGGGYRLRADLV